MIQQTTSLLRVSGLLLAALGLAMSASTTEATSRHNRDLGSSDDITNGSLDMRIPARVDIPKFYVVLSPTDHEFDEDENVILLDSTEDMLDWSFETATEYEDGTTFDSLSLLGIKSWFVPGAEEGSRTRRGRMRRSLTHDLDTPQRESNDIQDSGDEVDGDDNTGSALVSTMASHTILEIEGGEAEFFVPVNGNVPTTSMVASIVRQAIENDLLVGLQIPKQGGRNQIGGATADFSSISSAKYIESSNGVKKAEEVYEKEGQEHVTFDDTNTIGGWVKSEEGNAPSTRNEYAFTTIFVAVAVGGAMTIFVVAALVSKLRSRKNSHPMREFEDLDGGVLESDSEDMRKDVAAGDTKNCSMDFTHVITCEQVPPCSPLNDFLARTSPPLKHGHKKSPPVVGEEQGTPDTVILNDGLSIVSSEDSMECQLSVPSTATVDSDLTSVARNLHKTHFGKKAPQKKRSNLPPLDENAPYSVEDYMRQNPAISASLSRDDFIENADWNPNDNDAGSLSSDGFDEI
eukprot:CAMPEP_0181035282 /NCGR_PEP_ID=MMETSP1070-20121207/8242_1 /TAXON_ID=265543 /ORGANISM="Minutocellus polymorphus, Strain NH13" /LENGTH=516 /DNA_ID=CAMNT_0023112835 /DNA_START=287 /DNA_END=1837 /DNA_ORIENTATION=-